MSREMSHSLGKASQIFKETAQPLPRRIPAPDTGMPARPLPGRVADLLPCMTLEEKVYQLTERWEGNMEAIDPTWTSTAKQPGKTTWQRPAGIS